MPESNQIELSDLNDYKRYLQTLQDEAKAEFTTTTNVREIVTKRARQIDVLLQRIWANNDLDKQHMALLAVGGYGRGELHPYSDIDIAILLDQNMDAGIEATLQQFVTTLWDLGLDIGHSVRTVAETFEAAENDITVMTNLLESRLISGEQQLFDKINTVVRSDKLWKTERFFAEKLQEQKSRYRKFDDALQRLEPNVKESPGGLRDIQTISWVANRHFRSIGLHALREHDFLTDEEYASASTPNMFRSDK